MNDIGCELDISLESFSKVVESIYDCALDPGRWHDTVRLIADFSNSQWCVLGVTDFASGRNELTFHVGFPDEFWLLHESKYKGMNPYLAPLQLQPTGVVAPSTTLVDDSELFESRFYLELCKPYRLCDSVGFKVLQTGQRMGLLGANRVEPHPRYGDADFRLFSLLAPHVCRSVAISDALDLKAVKHDALETTLDALTSGVFLTDRYGRIVFMNHAAESQVRDGSAVRIEHDRLLPIDRDARTALSEALAQAVAPEGKAPPGGVSLALRADEGAGLVATVLPLTRGERQNLYGAFAAEVAIFVQDPVVVPPFPGEAFAKLHALTGAELRVVLAMAPGLGIKEAAEVLGISEATAKTHLQHVYAKTRTSKQTELMQLFMRSAPPVRTA